MNSSELEDRLIEFAVIVIKILEKLPNTRTGNNLVSQLTRSSSSTA